MLAESIAMNCRSGQNKDSDNFLRNSKVVSIQEEARRTVVVKRQISKLTHTQQGVVSAAKDDLSILLAKEDNLVVPSGPMLRFSLDLGQIRLRMCRIGDNGRLKQSSVFSKGYMSELLERSDFSRR